MWDISTSKLHSIKGMYHLMEYDKEEDDLVVTPELYASTHKGIIYAESEQGVGTLINIILPQQQL